MISIKNIREQARTIIIEQGKFLMEQIDKYPNRKQEFETKSTFKDLVTSLDIQVEERLKEKLANLLPNSEFLAEESVAAPINCDNLWIIDPIDGTTNFVHRFPFFCISVALQLAGELILGFVYNPLLNEFFEAGKDKGSFLNGQEIKVSTTENIAKSLLATGFAYNFADNDNNNVNYFTNFQAKSQGVRRPGSAALDLCYVAKGVFDGFWELYLKPWDVAAGILIVTEAGGKVSSFNDKKFAFDDEEILVTNGLIHQEMLAEIAQIRKNSLR